MLDVRSTILTPRLKRLAILLALLAPQPGKLQRIEAERSAPEIMCD